MTRQSSHFPQAVVAQGKRLLMEAALRLTARSRSLSAVGLRELAREAGLNPNTFYRHFKSIDELGLAIIEEMARQIRQPLRDLRRQAAAAVMPEAGTHASWEENPALALQRGMMVTQQTVRLFLDYTLEHPNAFIMGVRELHGASPVLRTALRQMMKDFAADMAADIQALNLLPLRDEQAIQEVATVVSREMFQLSMDYIEQPEQREAIRRHAETMITNLFTGASVLNGYGHLLLRAMPSTPDQGA